MRRFTEIMAMAAVVGMVDAGGEEMVREAIDQPDIHTVNYNEFMGNESSGDILNPDYAPEDPNDPISILDSLNPRT